MADMIQVSNDPTSCGRLGWIPPEVPFSQLFFDFSQVFVFKKSNYDLFELLLFCIWSMKCTTQVTRRASQF